MVGSSSVGPGALLWEAWRGQRCVGTFHPCVSGCCTVRTFRVLIPYFQLLLNAALQMQQGALRWPKEAFLKVASGEAALQAQLQSVRFA